MAGKIEEEQDLIGELDEADVMAGAHVSRELIADVLRQNKRLMEKLRKANEEVAQLRKELHDKHETDQLFDKDDGLHKRYWHPDEHQRFLLGLKKFGHKDMKAIAEFVGTRNTTQVRTHAQKYFMKLERNGKSLVDLGLPNRPVDEQRDRKEGEEPRKVGKKSKASDQPDMEQGGMGTMGAMGMAMGMGMPHPGFNVDAFKVDGQEEGAGVSASIMPQAAADGQHMASFPFGTPALNFGVAQHPGGKFTGVNPALSQLLGQPEFSQMSSQPMQQWGQMPAQQMQHGPGVPGTPSATLTFSQPDLSMQKQQQNFQQQQFTQQGFNLGFGGYRLNQS